MTGPSAAPDPIDPDPVRDLGARIRLLREGAELSGRALGVRAGITQSRVSRLENGVFVPTEDEIRAIGRAVGAADGTVGDLLERRVTAREWSVRQRVQIPVVGGFQSQVAAQEDRASTVLQFEPAVVPGLLQTSDYARVVISAAGLRSVGDDPIDVEIAAAVAARMRRQTVLQEPGKVFVFVLTEAVLSYGIARPAPMIGQIERIRQVAAQPNVDLVVIEQFVPAETPLHGFEILGDQVLVELQDRVLTLSTEVEVSTYTTFFDKFRSQATSDVGPILDRVRDGWIRRLQEETAGPG